MSHALWLRLLRRARAEGSSLSSIEAATSGSQTMRYFSLQGQRWADGASAALPAAAARAAHARGVQFKV